MQIGSLCKFADSGCKPLQMLAHLAFCRLRFWCVLRRQLYCLVQTRWPSFRNEHGIIQCVCCMYHDLQSFSKNYFCRCSRCKGKSLQILRHLQNHRRTYQLCICAVNILREQGQRTFCYDFAGKLPIQGMPMQGKSNSLSQKTAEPIVVPYFSKLGFR